jgi:hypothetical protein
MPSFDALRWCHVYSPHTVRSRRTGKRYYTYRLVETYRTATGVRQRTLLNLGTRFEVPREQWSALAQRIEALLFGQLDLMPNGLDPRWETIAQRYAAQLIRARVEPTRKEGGEGSGMADYQRIDISQVDLLQPRSVGVEAVALSALHQLSLDKKLHSLGFNTQQLPVAIGRMIKPASELATHAWLHNQRGVTRRPRPVKPPESLHKPRHLPHILGKVARFLV